MLLRAKLLYIYSVFRRAKTDKEIDEEFQFHIEMSIRENLSEGMSPEEAKKAALQRFGNIYRIKEAGREIRRGTTMDSLSQDFHYSLKTLIKKPKLVLIVVITMALGIGANAAIFSVVNAFLLKPLPYEEPGELALIWSDFQKTGAARAPASGLQLREIRDRSRLLQDVAGIWVGNGTFIGEGEPEQVKLGSVTPNFFSVLGASPALGRAFLAEEQAIGVKEIILSHAIWQRRFGADPNIIGQTVRLNGGSFTVVGVMPSEFLLAFPQDSNVPRDIQAWAPFQYNIYEGPRDLYYIRLLARLRSGVTIQQAQGEVKSIAQHLRDEFTEYNVENLQLDIVALHEDLIRNIRPTLTVLFVGAGLVLLICCFNVANLLLARATERRKEISLRAALGATKWRIARQLLSESLLICCMGGALGLAIGWLGLKMLIGIRPDGLPLVATVNLDLTVLAFVSALSIGSGIIAGLAPMLETRKVNLSESLKEGGKTSAGLIKSRARTVLIVSEIALGFVLLAGAGLMIRTLIELHKTSPGFDPDHVLTFDISPPGDDASARTNFVTQWEEVLSALPGVESVGAISHLPLDDYPNWYSPYAPEGVTQEQKVTRLADYRAVTRGYFHALSARLIDGRYFNELDSASNRSVVIVDNLLARATWPDESAIGKKLNIEQFTDNGFVYDWAEVVGVVEHIKSHSLLKPLRGQIYIPYPQSSREHLSFVMRTGGDPMALVSSIRSELNKLDKNRAIAKVRPMSEYVSKAMAATNFTTVLASIFALLALLLAAVGIYSVVSYSVSQRSHEIGVRMALGARSIDVLRLIMKEGLAWAASGLAFGFMASFAVSGYLQSLLFQVTPLDPVTHIFAALAIPLATLLACWGPALKAASGNPVDAMRS